MLGLGMAEHHLDGLFLSYSISPMVVRDRCNRTRVCVGRRHIGQLGALLLAVSLFLAADPASGQERGIVPVTVDGEQVKLATITYKPEGTGPFPVLIFHHGSTGAVPIRLCLPSLSIPSPMLSGSLSVVGRWCCRRGGSKGRYDEGFSDDRGQG